MTTLPRGQDAGRQVSPSCLGTGQVAETPLELNPVGFVLFYLRQGSFSVAQAGIRLTTILPPQPPHPGLQVCLTSPGPAWFLFVVFNFTCMTVCLCACKCTT